MAEGPLPKNESTASAESQGALLAAFSLGLGGLYVSAPAA
jgi:hypothetical protein